MAAGIADKWFELSNDGWRRMNAGRPLGALVREAIQNAFDEDADAVAVTHEATRIVIEDNGSRGFADARQVYTVFLTDKADSPTRRGRKGRGLKELISAADSAVVETVGQTVCFDRQGRHVQDNDRARGTRIELTRKTAGRDIEAALAALRLISPPEGVTLSLNRKAVPRPRLIASLDGCELDTVVERRGTEALLRRATTVRLYEPRRGESPHVFEMGLPVQPIRCAWHVDVAQRLPLADGRDKLDQAYVLALLSLLFASAVDELLPTRGLKDDWIMEVLAGGWVSDEVLATYARRAFPERAVLASNPRADDRARQVGARLIDTRGMSRSVVETLGRVLDTSASFVDRQLAAAEERVRTPTPEQRRTVEVFAYLAQRLLGRAIEVVLIRKPAALDGWIDDAMFDRDAKRLALNVQGHVDFADPLGPASLAVLFHELAHNRTPEHDWPFIRELERVAGRGARLLADEAAMIRERFGLGGRGAGAGDR